MYTRNVPYGCAIFGLSYHINPFHAELNPICHLLALLGAHHIFHVSGLRVEAHLCLKVCGKIFIVLYEVLSQCYQE